MIITSLENNKIKELSKLSSPKYRKEYNKFIIEGNHLVEEAYKAGILEEVFILENKRIDIDIEFTYVTSDVMRKITNLESMPDIIGICKIVSSDIKGKHILALDNMQDPGNLGTIIRSAVAFNIDTIILSEDTVDLYNSKVLRATQGMIFHINVLKANLLDELTKLKINGYDIYSTNVKNGVDIKNIKNKDKYVIIIGNEGNGVSSGLSKLSNQNIYIKTNSKCESLNAGVAASIILYEMSDK